MHETEATDPDGTPRPRLSQTLNDMLIVMLLTARRRGEVCTMRWQDVDLTTAWWTIPAESSKNADPHRVPRIPMVVEILKRRASAKKVDDRYVFSSHRSVPCDKEKRRRSKRGRTSSRQATTSNATGRRNESSMRCAHWWPAAWQTRRSKASRPIADSRPLQRRASDREDGYRVPPAIASPPRLGDRITHRIEITSKADIDDDVKRWLKKAYEMDA